MMVSSQVEIVSKQLVKPSHPTPHSLRHLKLSFLDQLQNLVPIYIPLIFFYKNDHQLSSNKIDPSQRSQHLKQSLSETLTKFYPFAGRVDGNASIDCNDSGALYVEARVHSHLSEAIQNANTKDLEQYLPVLTRPRNPIERSSHVLLAVQTTFFECGGMAVGLCLSHIIADGISFFTFMNEWAQKSRSTTEISTMQPDFDMRLNCFPTSDILSGFFPDPKVESIDPSPSEEEKIVMKRFLFDKKILSAMKLQVSSSSSTSCLNPTRVETVSAFIWKHLIDITRAKSSHHTKRAFVAVNMRPRISPPLTEFAIGNIFVFTAALAESQNAQDYVNLVSPLRTAIRTVGDDYIKDEQKRQEYLGLLCQPEYHLFTSWCRFPYYEVDFGWGKPLSVCTASLPLKNTVVLMDTRSGDGIQAWISLGEDEMAMLPDELLALESNDFRK